LTWAGALFHQSGALSFKRGIENIGSEDMAEYMT
jgi:hypothetical protein